LAVWAAKALAGFKFTLIFYMNYIIIRIIRVVYEPQAICLRKLPQMPVRREVFRYKPVLFAA